MAIEPTTTITRQESYDLGSLGNKHFEVNYVHRSLERKEGGERRVTNLDQEISLEELTVNHYETPTRGNASVEDGVSKGRSTSRSVIRSVFMELSCGQNLTQVWQYGDISNVLDDRINHQLPSHVKKLLRTELTDPGITPYDFNFPEF